MSLQERIQGDLTAAMKARERDRVAALRLARAALQNAAVAEGLGPQGELSAAQAQRVLTTEVKRRREAADAYRAAGRPEPAAHEEAEAALYTSYLPEQLSDADLAAIVDRVIAETGAGSLGDVGPVMRAAMGDVAGRADGSRVSALVRERLTTTPA